MARFSSVALVLVFLITACGGGGGDSTGSDSGGVTDASSTVKITSTNPEDGATAVALTVSGSRTHVYVWFDDLIDTTTLTSSTGFTLDGGSGSIAGAVTTTTVSGSKTEMLYIPTSTLSTSTLHTATVASTVKDTGGASRTAAYSWTFTTE